MTGDATILRDLAEERNVPLAIVQHHVEAGTKPGGYAFIYRRGGKITYKKYRSHDRAAGMMAVPKGAEHHLFGLDDIFNPFATCPFIVITEGEWDKITAEAAGFDRSCSVPDGSPSETPRGLDGHMPWVYDILDPPQVNRQPVTYVIATDDDKKGNALAEDLAAHLGRSVCRRVVFPEGCKDLSDVAVNHGLDAVRDAITAAPFIDLGGPYRWSEVPVEDYPTFFSTGIPGMDMLYKPAMGTMLTVTGHNGHGKSTLIKTICAHLSHLYGWRIGLCLLEESMAVTKRFYARWYCGGTNEFPKPHQRPFPEWAEERLFPIIPDVRTTRSFDWMLEQWDAAVVRFGCRVLVLDPWTQLHMSVPKGLNMTDYVQECQQRMRAFISDRRIHAIIAAHPRMMPRSEIPNQSHIAGSAHFGNFTDVGLTVFQSNESAPGGITYKDTQIVNWKARFAGEIGSEGARRFTFDQSKSLWHEAGMDPEDMADFLATLPWHSGQKQLLFA